jgi:hypothetical protein
MRKTGYFYVFLRILLLRISLSCNKMIHNNTKENRPESFCKTFMQQFDSARRLKRENPSIAAGFRILNSVCLWAHRARKHWAGKGKPPLTRGSPRAALAALWGPALSPRRFDGGIPDIKPFFGDTQPFTGERLWGAESAVLRSRTFDSHPIMDYPKNQNRKIVRNKDLRLCSPVKFDEN